MKDEEEGEEERNGKIERNEFEEMRLGKAPRSKARHEGT